MDFGSSDFNTSVHWLMQRYAALGVEFDEIWGYELREMDLNEYWRSVPADAKPRLHVRVCGGMRGLGSCVCKCFWWHCCRCMAPTPTGRPVCCRVNRPAWGFISRGTVLPKLAHPQLSPTTFCSAFPWCCPPCCPIAL